MAVQTISITPNLAVTPFSGRPVGTDEKSYLPRAKVEFQANNASIAAKTIGNTLTANVTCELPVNYAYVLCGIHVEVGSTTDMTSDAFQDNGYGQLNPDTTVTNDRLYFPIVSDGPINLGATDRKVWYPKNTPGNVILNFAGNSPTLFMQLYDDVTAAGAAARSMYFTATFLQYDIRQADHVRVNAPIPTRLC